MMNLMRQLLLMIGFLAGIVGLVQAQSYLHTEGKNIVTGNGEPIILRGIGTGNWMLMEGYMMKTEGIAGTQHEFEAKLIETIGAEKTETFFNTWLANHFTRTDVDSMKAWGFNSVRVAMHYKWFTPPIEEELIPGEVTWRFKGFQMIDQLLDWCEANEMYLILDLHGAPGGQGANADISDYDPSKPSLWESQANKDKTVALWRKLAERYANEPWIGGYDLINETNWTFPEGNNSQMRELFGRITEAIREVDNNHIIFIEGNNWANDFSGLTPPWDNNMVYSFHKYWSGTGANDLDWVLDIRDEHNVPIWMGESGENSNTWFTDFIELCETNNVGWSWWPVKKNGINNVLNVPINKGYEDLVKYWKGEISTAPTQTQAYQAVMQWAENHKIENCTVQYDVIDAMIRQPHTDAVIPFKKHQLLEPIFFSEFDLGRNGIAYFDHDVAHDGGDWTAWNTGWGLRNDGVDIEASQDPGGISNGYQVGWTAKNEWMQYSLSADSTAKYTLKIRHASLGSGSKMHLEVNGADVTGELTLPSTGGWQNWKTATFENIVIPGGAIQLKWVFDSGSSNLNYFEFSNPESAASVDFQALAASTSTDGFEISIGFNKEITSTDAELNLADFQLSVDGTPVSLLSVQNHPSQSSVLIIKHDKKIYSDQVVTVGYDGESVRAGSQNLLEFSGLVAANNLHTTYQLPGKIQAENFYHNNGLALEDCQDLGGGQNTGHAAAGDYLDYQVHVANAGNYRLEYRVATEKTDAELIFQVGDGENFSSLDTIQITSTGGWQKWETQTSTVYLEAGYYFVRLLVKKGEHNLNWFNLDVSTSVNGQQKQAEYRIYPNPAKDKLYVNFSASKKSDYSVKIISLQGNTVLSQEVVQAGQIMLDLRGLSNGIYFIQIAGNGAVTSKKFVIMN
ncbi:carbohydrate-binding protein [Sunxiuqinia dokdonensis]|uniref:Glycoside hydrolase family 5 n=1 Tax=Sunxiuqinia dokdonensis TaxID=1409788 RepID=A0A0L8V461_9BACT|nr:carbohydrate-binding protein [Sunxiuqinia dokdonensis]KOH43206.1 glycoside hydrolase family 5 [Sunxiuqinia dokdonensis]